MMNSLQRVSSAWQILLLKKSEGPCVLYSSGFTLFPSLSLSFGPRWLSDEWDAFKVQQGFSVQKSKTIDQAALRPGIKPRLQAGFAANAPVSLEHEETHTHLSPQQWRYSSYVSVNDCREACKFPSPDIPIGVWDTCYLNNVTGELVWTLVWFKVMSNLRLSADLTFINLNRF